MASLCFLLALALLSFETNAVQRIRRVELAADEIAAVHTAQGVATIIQVPDRPSSLVLGDPESFKVEYLDQAITIKPLRSQARSNLYVYTDYRRFDVELTTVGLKEADYVVYLSGKEKGRRRSQEQLVWRPFARTIHLEKYDLRTTRLGLTKEAMFLEMEIKAMSRFVFNPSVVWLTQGGKTTPIDRFAFSSLEASPNAPIRASLKISLRDISTAEALRLEIREKTVRYITLPKVSSWIH